jgi:hypothetical protein
MLFLAIGGPSRYPQGISSVDSARYTERALFSTEVIKNRSPRFSCSAPARVRCSGGKEEGFILSDDRKLDTLPPLPHFRLINRSL